MSSLIKRFQTVNKILARRQHSIQHLKDVNKYIVNNIDYQKASLASESIKLILSAPNESSLDEISLSDRII
jgi:hypothetical protein